jgi:integrase
MKNTPVTANRVLSCVRKIFNLAEVWSFRDDGTNPCRHIPKYAESGQTWLITNEEMARLFQYLHRADLEGLEHPFLTLAIRLQFAFAARMSYQRLSDSNGGRSILQAVAWCGQTAKPGEISKPMSEDAIALLSNAPRLESSPYVVPSILNPARPMSQYTYSYGWKRILNRAKIPHVGTHGMRHRTATEIANSGVPVKVGMQLTAHKTVTQFMRYVHTEDEAVRSAAEAVASRRKTILQEQSIGVSTVCAAATIPMPAPSPAPTVADGRDVSRTSLGSYRPFELLPVPKTPS